MKCGHDQDIIVPDNKVRLDTLKFMVEQGLPKLLEKPRDNREELARRFLEDVENMSDLELAMLVTGDDHAAADEA